MPKKKSHIPKKHEYLAYDGPKKKIEFYYTDTGKIPGVEFLNSLPDSEKADFAALFALMGDRGVIRNEKKFRHLEGKIYEFKASPNRVCCFFYSGGLIVLTHGFIKKRQDTPRKEIERAIAIHEDFLDRMKRGEYYEGQV